MSSTLTDHRAIEFNAAELAQFITSCFEGYIVPFVLDAPGFENRFRPEGLDTQASLLVQDGDDPAALCLIARRGWTARVAAMAVAPNHRRTGVGKRLMEKVIEEAKERGDKRLVLEVIEQNPAAISLYQAVGMNITRRLVGYKRVGGDAQPEPLDSIDPLAFTRRMIAECDLDLPWDFLPETLNSKAPPSEALALENSAFALVTEAPARTIVWSLFVNRDKRGQGYGSRLVRALSAKFGGKDLVTPVALPDTVAPQFFTKLGFVSPEISQFEMEIKL